jgi:hypothetical protein
MLIYVLLSAVALRYYNCCTDGSTGHGNYEYPLHVLGVRICHYCKYFNKNLRYVSTNTGSNHNRYPFNNELDKCFV